VDEKIADIGTNAFAVRKYSLDDFAPCVISSANGVPHGLEALR